MSKTDYVVGFVFSSDRSKVVLVKKNRPEWQAGFYNGVGGKMEEEDQGNSFHTMTREFREETGVEVSYLDWELYAVLSGCNFLIKVFCLFSDEVVAKVTTVTDEPIEIVDVDLNVLRTTAISNAAWLIGAALDGDRNRFALEVTYA